MDQAVSLRESCLLVRPEYFGDLRPAAAVHTYKLVSRLPRDHLTTANEIHSRASCSFKLAPRARRRVPSRCAPGLSLLRWRFQNRPTCPSTTPNNRAWDDVRQVPRAVPAI